MKKIPLSQTSKEGVKKFALVDNEDYEWLMQWPWAIGKHNNREVAMRTERIGKNKYVTRYMHIEIMKAPKGMRVDHKDHNTLDNRKKFLRVCTNSQNLANRKINKNNTSGYKNVSPFGKKWVVQVARDYIGTFKSKIAAARAADMASIQKYGEYATTNFPRSNYNTKLK